MKHPKWQKGRQVRGIEQKGTKLNFGSFGLRAMEARWLTVAQLDSARITIIKNLKKKGKMWLRIFPYKPITSKGPESDMGKGKGKVDHYVFPVRPGRMIFELGEMEEQKARSVLKQAAAKLPIKTKFVKEE